MNVVKVLQPTLETDSYYNYSECCTTTSTLTTVLVAAIWWHCLELCRKCKRLAPLQITSEKYKEILVCFFGCSASIQELISILKWQQWPQCRICGDTRRNMVPCAPSDIQTCGSEQCIAVTSNDSPGNEMISHGTQAKGVLVGSSSRSSKFLILS